MSKTTMAMAFAVMLTAGMATANAQTAAPTPRAEVTTNHLLAGQIRVSEMAGAAVYDNQTQKIGSIKDIILDPDGRVAAVVLNVKGTFGLSRRYVALGVGDLKISNSAPKPRFTVCLSRDQLRTAQTYDLHEAKLNGTSTPPPPDDRPPPADRED